MIQRIWVENWPNKYQIRELIIYAKVALVLFMILTMMHIIKMVWTFGQAVHKKYIEKKKIVFYSINSFWIVDILYFVCYFIEQLILQFYNTVKEVTQIGKLQETERI